MSILEIDRILLIDDDYSTNLYNEIILSESGIVKELEFETNATDALMHLNSGVRGPDIIFLDINMPIKSGWDFLEDYSELPLSKRSTKLVVLSTTKIPEEVIAANEHHLIDHFVTKPLTIDVVRDVYAK